MFDWFKPRLKFKVTFECCGEYLNVHDGSMDLFEGPKFVDFEVIARSFGEAEKLALKLFNPPFKVFSYWVKSVVLTEEYL